MKVMPTIRRDLVSPRLAKLAAQAGNRREILEAMGLELAAVTREAFVDPAARPAPWAPVKKTDGPALMSKNPVLSRSFRVVVGTRSVEVGTDRKYAPYHQFGTKPYEIRPKVKRGLWWPGLKHPVKLVRHPGLPPRPFFPCNAAGKLTERARARLRAIVEAKLKGAAK